MWIAILLATLTAAPVHTAPQPACDAIECDVLTATLLWAYQQVPEERRDRTFFDIGQAMSHGIDGGRAAGFRRATVELAHTLDLSAAERENQREFADCVARLVQCAEGTTWLGVRDPRVVAPGEAVANVSTLISGEVGVERGGLYGNVKEVGLRLVDGSWVVTGSRVIIRVN